MPRAMVKTRVDGLVGSMQWADASGATRVISSADAIHRRDYRFEGPYYHARRHRVVISAQLIHSIPTEQRGSGSAAKFFDAVLCGRLGEVLPERLWQAPVNLVFTSRQAARMMKLFVV